MSGIRSYNKACKFLDSSKTHALRRQHEPKKYNCSGLRTNTRSCSCVCPYSIRIFQVRVTVVHAMNTLEFYNFGVKITYSRIKVYTRRSHILWIHSLNFASRRMLCTRTVTFFYKVLFTKGSPSYSRITTDVWYTLTKILERLWTERIPPYSTRIFQVYVTCCVRLEYSRILLRHNHIFESRILQNILAFTQCDALWFLDVLWCLNALWCLETLWCLDALWCLETLWCLDPIQVPLSYLALVSNIERAFLMVQEGKSNRGTWSLTEEHESLDTRCVSRKRWSCKGSHNLEVV